jgi:hypothetical protein
VVAVQGTSTLASHAATWTLTGLKAGGHVATAKLQASGEAAQNTYAQLRGMCPV